VRKLLATYCLLPGCSCRGRLHQWASLPPKAERLKYRQRLAALDARQAAALARLYEQQAAAAKLLATPAAGSA
jgi:hypothetical protein